MKGAAGRDQGGLAVARQISPQAADNERLHRGAGPYRRARTDAQAKPASHVGVFVEGDFVAAKRKAVHVVIDR
jgi:bifunctional N-acetylglucosamine-1-phosphate-uridyltransferase/glucosamine-1-phosphate-acetyltransferase GlmU-like protein